MREIGRFELRFCSGSYVKTQEGSENTGKKTTDLPAGPLRRACRQAGEARRAGKSVVFFPVFSEPSCVFT